MLPDVQNLIDLQLADREVLRLKEEIAALPKRVAAIEGKLAGTKAVLENAKIAVKADEANRRALHARFLYSQKFAQDDPWTERANGTDAHEFARLPELADA